MTVCFRHGVWGFFILVVLLSCGQQEDKNGDEGGGEEEIAESAQIDSAEADTLAEEIPYRRDFLVPAFQLDDRNRSSGRNLSTDQRHGRTSSGGRGRPG